ncbi:hypothetical protein KC853_01950 [Candidatus Saccharibacteria bacterium]|nr:hypothetical protein [Candidatus Saccharibacteria bacterium]MCB9834452.1 hypothetical protein [Candidatus Nomurabacteria bacterium]
MRDIKPNLGIFKDDYRGESGLDLNVGSSRATALIDSIKTHLFSRLGKNAEGMRGRAKRIFDFWKALLNRDPNIW